MKRWLDRCFPYIAIAWTTGALMFNVFLGVAGGGWLSWGLAALMAVLLVFQILMVRGIRRMRMANATDTFDEPIPPQNVRIEQLDGTIVPVELIYGGREAGMHKWIAVTPVTGLDRGAILKADMIPADTAIAIQNIQNMPPEWPPGGPLS